MDVRILSTVIEASKQVFGTVVTSRLYTRERFIKESEKLGCNRSIPANILRQLAWSDSVVVCDWQSTETDLYGTLRRKVYTRTERGISAEQAKTMRREVYAPKGKLIPFGYFSVDAVVPNGFTDEARQEFNKTLNVVKVIEAEPVRVVRACGGYLLGGGLQVTDPIQSIVDKAENIAKLHSLKLKWFAAGKFREINAAQIDGPKYSRGYYKLSVNVPRDPAEPLRVVQFISDYNKKKYAPSRERNNLRLDEI